MCKSYSIIQFFVNSKESNHSTYREMYNYMMANENDVLVAENEDGLHKAKNEEYAFLMESASIEYLLNV